jgi:hypothetical protein
MDSPAVPAATTKYYARQVTSAIGAAVNARHQAAPALEAVANRAPKTALPSSFGSVAATIATTTTHARPLRQEPASAPEDSADNANQR